MWPYVGFSPVLFSVFINNIGKHLKNAKLQLYADDTVVYSVAPPPRQANTDGFRLNYFNSHCFNLVKLRKLKSCLSPDPPANTLYLCTLNRDPIKKVSSYKYLGIEGVINMHACLLHTSPFRLHIAVLI